MSLPLIQSTSTAQVALYATQETREGAYLASSRTIVVHTIVDISPVLLFEKDEYDAHGEFTTLDQYTFKWPGGRMALALGLGSLFNHSNTPNVSFSIDTRTNSIRYTTTRLVKQGEELCTFYGNHIWFTMAESTLLRDQKTAEPENDDGRGGLSAVDEDAFHDRHGPFLDGGVDDIFPEDELPFIRLRITPDEDEEEDMDAIRTMNAWVVDIPDPRQITTMLKWLKQADLDSDLGHLKRVRRIGTVSTLLLSTTPVPPPLPVLQPPLPEPYPLSVPQTAALTAVSAKLKSSLWPTVYAPRRKGEAEPWSRGRVRWAWEAMRLVANEVRMARAAGELPVVAHVPSPYELHAPSLPSFTARDHRKSAKHPLRHAVLDVIRQVADYRASTSTRASPPSSLVPVPVPRASDLGVQIANGTNYLLTSLTLFTSHEPCVMCSMALLHSRVKEVVYLRAMPRTGGCGGAACLPRLRGVNHRFTILQWKLQDCQDINVDGLRIEEDVDA